MTGFARTLSATSAASFCAWSADAASSSSSKNFPCRTSPTPLYPIECSASAMVLPCGSNTDFFRVTKTRAFIMLHGGSEDPPYKDSRGCHHGGAAEGAIDDRVHVAQLVVEVERLLHGRRRQHLHHVGIRQDQRLEILLLVERAHRVALHPLVGLLARDPALGELEQQRSREDDAPRAPEILEH